MFDQDMEGETPEDQGPGEGPGLQSKGALWALMQSRRLLQTEKAALCCQTGRKGPTIVPLKGPPTIRRDPETYRAIIEEEKERRRKAEHVGKQLTEQLNLLQTRADKEMDRPELGPPHHRKAEGSPAEGAGGVRGAPAEGTLCSGGAETGPQSRSPTAEGAAQPGGQCPRQRHRGPSGRLRR